MNKTKTGAKEVKTTYNQTTKRVAKVIAADGVFSRIQNEICHLLFYTNAPYFKNKDDNKIYVGQEEQLQIEIRLTKESLNQLIESLFNEIKMDQQKDEKKASSSSRKEKIQDAVEVA